MWQRLVGLTWLSGEHYKHTHNPCKQHSCPQKGWVCAACSEHDKQLRPQAIVVVVGDRTKGTEWLRYGVYHASRV